MIINYLIQKNVLALTLFTTFSFAATAQLQTEKIDSAIGKKVETRSPQILSTLVNAIRPQSFISSFAKQKKAFILQSETVSKAPEILEQISKLAKSLKPEKFKPGKSAESIMQTDRSITPAKQVSIALRNFEDALKPDTFSIYWSLQRKSWLDEVHAMD